MALVAIFRQATTGEIVRQRVYERRLRGDENRHYKDKQTPVTKKSRHRARSVAPEDGYQTG